jgi:hypothetical protein
MRMITLLLCLCAANLAMAQEAPPIREPSIPEYTERVPSDVPDTTDWIAFGERGAATKLTKYSRYTGIFLSVLAPEGACTPEALPCDVVMRFSFWRKDDSSDALHIARFVTESNGRIVEGIAKTDRTRFWYWIRRAGLWMPVEREDSIYKAHEEFYVFLMLLTEADMLQQFLKQMEPPEPPAPKEKEVAL